MKKVMALLVVLLVNVVFILAATISVETETQVFESKTEALTAAQKIAADIDKGTSKIALAEGAVWCPKDNTPKFQVKKIQLNSFYPVEGTAEKFVGQVVFEMNCTHPFQKGGNQLAFMRTLEIATPVYSTEKQAIDAAKFIAKRVNGGESQLALAEGAVACPTVNTPKFEVNDIKINSFMPANANFEERFMGIIQYKMDCSK